MFSAPRPFTDLPLAMSTDRPERPEVKVSKSGNLYVDVEELFNSKIGRRKIRRMSEFSKQILKNRQTSSPSDGGTREVE